LGVKIIHLSQFLRPWLLLIHYEYVFLNCSKIKIACVYVVSHITTVRRYTVTLNAVCDDDDDDDDDDDELIFFSCSDSE